MPFPALGYVTLSLSAVQSSPFGRRCPRRGRRPADLARSRHPCHCPAKFRSPEPSTRRSNPGPWPEPLLMAQAESDASDRARARWAARSFWSVYADRYSLEARAQAVLLGLLGTLLLNLGRMAA